MHWLKRQAGNDKHNLLAERRQLEEKLASHVRFQENPNKRKLNNDADTTSPKFSLSSDNTSESTPASDFDHTAKQLRMVGADAEAPLAVDHESKRKRKRSKKERKKKSLSAQAEENQRGD